MKNLEIKEMFRGNDINDVITQESEFIKDGQVVEISAKNGSHQNRRLFLVCFMIYI